MTMNRRDFLAIAGRTAVVLPTTSMLAIAAMAADEILVGGLHDETGGLDFAGAPMQQMVRFACDEINDQGGLLGKQVKAVTADTGSNMQLYQSLAQQVALRDKVNVVMGESPPRAAKLSGRFFTGSTPSTSTTHSMKGAYATGTASAPERRRRRPWRSSFPTS
jgi:hypothetical protein